MRRSTSDCDGSDADAGFRPGRHLSRVRDVLHGAEHRLGAQAGKHSAAISAGGTYALDLSTNYVQVNTSGAVTIVLPSTLNSPAGPGAQPGTYVAVPVVIADIGGNAQAHPITIQAAAGDTVMGLASIQITVNFGAYTLQPNSAQRTWSAIVP